MFTTVNNRIPMYVRDNTSMQCDVVMFAFQCVYATIHLCNAMSSCLHSNVCTRQYIYAMRCPSCLHSNVCTRQYIYAMRCPHVCIPMCVRDNTYAMRCRHVCIPMCVRDNTYMQCDVRHVCIPMCVRDNTYMQCDVVMFAFQCVYATIHICNAMSSCLHSNVCTRQYIYAMRCPHVCIPMCVRDNTSMQCDVRHVCITMCVRDNTSMQCDVLMFAFQCVYATIHICNAMSSCLHSNVCTRQYICAMRCRHVCIPMCVRDNTYMQCDVVMFAFQCVYATIYICNAMPSCLHSNVCTRQYIYAMRCPHVCIPMCVRDNTYMQCDSCLHSKCVRDNTSVQCDAVMFAFQCVYATIYICNAMPSCLHSNVCTRQYIYAMRCPHVCIPMCVRDNTSVQCDAVMFAFQCVYATIHLCNAMPSCLHSNVCTRQYIYAMRCPHVCIPICVRHWFSNRSGSLKKVILKKLFRLKLEAQAIA